MTVPQRLERVVPIRQRQEPPTKDVREQVLIGELERLDLWILVQRLGDLLERREGGVQDDEARVEEVVRRFRELGGGERSRSVRERMGAVLWDPVRRWEVSATQEKKGRTYQSVG